MPITKEEKICSFNQKGKRLQLIKISTIYLQPDGTESIINKYQVRLNRRIIDTSISEYTERKIFAIYCQNIICIDNFASVRDTGEPINAPDYEKK